MARVFLDTNYFIDALHRRPEKQILNSLEGNVVVASPLSLHIFCYIFKIKLPNKNIEAQISKLQFFDFSENILGKSLKGPTNDFEDNVQLHSSAETGCEIFLTNDTKLLKLKFFGKARILPELTKYSQ